MLIRASTTAVASFALLLSGCGGSDGSGDSITADSLLPLSAACSQTGMQTLAVAAFPVNEALGATVTSTRVVPAAATVPEYCEVNVDVVTPGNTETKFRLGLPTGQWNQKFYFVGAGGFAGVINSIDEGLRRNYATVTTNAGHIAINGSNGQPDVSDGSWAYLDEAQRIDWADRAAKVTTDISKSMVRAAYNGNAIRHSYFVGCSNGGRMGMIALQRFSRDFDGVVARDPVIGLSTGFDWVQNALLASPASYLPLAKYQLLRTRIIAQCDLDDNVADQVVSNPRTCTFNPASIQCSGADAADCLTAAQVSTVNTILGGPKTSSGTQLFVGFPQLTGSDEGWRFWMGGGAFTNPPINPTVPQSDGTLAYAARGLASQQWRLGTDVLRYFVYDNPTYDGKQFNFDTEFDRFVRTASLYNPESTDLSGFRSGGGKLILTHGWEDQLMTPLRTTQYYDALTAATGAQTPTYARLFMLPGVNHCRAMPGDRGSTEDDAVIALERWVEQGVAPETIETRRKNQAGALQWTRPVCAYPRVARFTGTGSSNDAANFTCQ